MPEMSHEFSPGFVETARESQLRHPFLRTFLGFDILPLVEFQPETWDLIRKGWWHVHQVCKVGIA